MAILRQILENILRDSSKAMPISKEIIALLCFRETNFTNVSVL